LPDILAGQAVVAERPEIGALLDGDGVAVEAKRPKRTPPTVLDILRIAADWQGRQACQLSLATAVHCEVKWKRPLAHAAAAAAGSADGVDATMFDDEGDGHGDADDGGDHLSDRLCAFAIALNNTPAHTN
jgi:hypothetical protein